MALGRAGGATLVLSLSLAAVPATGGDARQPAPGATSGPKLQPVISAPAPRERHRSEFGTVRVHPSAIVAGAPGQDVRVTVDPHRAAPDGSLRVRVFRPALPNSPRTGRAVDRVGLASRTLQLDGTAPRGFELSNLNPPPGRYRINLVAPATHRALGHGSLLVYGQTRLPPQVYAGAEAPGRAAAGPSASGTSAQPSPGVRALPSGAINNNLTNDTGDEAESYVAAEPDNASRVIAAVNPASGNPKAWISNDSMKPGTSVVNTLPSTSKRPTAEGGGTQNLSLCCDPALAADDRGNLWYSVLTTGGTGHIIINRAAGPSGTAFQAQNTMIPRVTTCSSCQDKNMIGVDSWSTSPKRYRLYAVWTENPGQNIVISECDGATASNCDNPDNWSVPAHVTSSAGSYIYASVAAAPNGDVYVAWVDYAEDDIEIDRCKAAENCTSAASWNEETDIDTDLDPGSASALPFFCPIIAAPGGRVSANTYVDVGPDGRVYVVWAELRNNNTGRCNANANDRSFDSLIAAGATNTIPTVNTGVRLTDDSATALNDHFWPTLAADPSLNNTVESSFYSTKLDATRKTTNQFYVSSTNGGTSYGAMQQFTTAASDFSGSNSDGFDYGDYQGSDSAQGVFYPVWSDNRASAGGDTELFMLTPPAGPPRTLNVSLAGTGSGTVTGPGINCPGDCTESYSDGSQVTLNASASVGNAFAGWSGDCSGTGSCVLTMNANKNVTATFNSVPVRTLNVTVDGAGTGTVTGPGINCPGDCSESYNDGTNVTLNANPSGGSSFSGWSGDCSGTGSCQLTMNANKAASATFDPAPQRTLNVSVLGPGLGMVTGPGIDCPGDCSESYSNGTSVSLTPTPLGGSSFAGFSGDCVGATCQLTMSADRSVTATFALLAAPGPVPDTTPPQTTIGKHPKKRTTSRKARFTFSASEPGARLRLLAPAATFQCKLDRKRWRLCTSPKRYKHLKLGRHKFKVRAIDIAGNVDPTPAKWRWRVIAP